MQQTIDSIVFTEPYQVALGQFEPADEIVVKTIYTMVSPGTEGRVLGGHYGISNHFPLIPGYIVVGQVNWVGEAATGWRVGDLVSGRNPLLVPGTGSYRGGQASYHIYPTNGDARPELPVSANLLDYMVAELADIVVETSGSITGVETAYQLLRGYSINHNLIRHILMLASGLV